MLFQLDGIAPTLSQNNFIAPSANLIGDVQLKANASVWFNVVIRADLAPIKVGENTNIQDGSILHVDANYPMTIGDNVTIGHKVMLHGCKIGNNSLIGMNAVVLNGAKIGNNCLIGANSLVTENMEIPDGHLAIGSPAKVIRALDSKQFALFEKSAQHYVDNAKRYQSELTPVSND